MPEPASTESSDVSPQRVVAGALIIWATMILVALAVMGLQRAWNLAPDAGPNQPLKMPPPEPALLSAPQTDRAAYEAGKVQLLTRYAWVDRRKGWARIPIDAAIALMAQGSGGRP